MPVNEDDSAAVTGQQPSLYPGRISADPGVFCGRARPVVLSDVELSLIGEADDPRTAYRAWLRATDHGNVETTGAGAVVAPGGHPTALPSDEGPSLGSLIAHGAVIMLLAIPAMLIVAFGIAAATR